MRRAIDPTLGAIVMTGHGTIDTAVQAMQGGALDYISQALQAQRGAARHHARARCAAAAAGERRIAGAGALAIR